MQPVSKNLGKTAKEALVTAKTVVFSNFPWNLQMLQKVLYETKSRGSVL
jgi:hypothetical protein